MDDKCEKNSSFFYSKCVLCPRRCGVDRRVSRGYCASGDVPVVNISMIHKGEEPPISGGGGSGAVFFEGCSLGCPFCQNYKISHRARISPSGGAESVPAGKAVTSGELVRLFYDLKEKGADNINLVTPMHFAPDVAAAMELARSGGFDLPFIINCGGYENVETVRLFDGLADIWLPDFKFLDPKVSSALVNVGDYGETAVAAIDEMVRQTGPLVYDDRGLIRRGVIIRHLMMPSCLFDTKKIIDTIWERWGDTVALSLMNQYTPMPQLQSMKGADPRLMRKLDPRHYRAAVDHLLILGKQNVFLQEDASGDEMIPDFI